MSFNVENGNTFNLETNNYPLYKPDLGMSGNKYNMLALINSLAVVLRRSAHTDHRNMH